MFPSCNGARAGAAGRVLKERSVRQQLGEGFPPRVRAAGRVKDLSSLSKVSHGWPIIQPWLNWLKPGRGWQYTVDAVRRLTHTAGGPSRVSVKPKEKRNA